MPSSVKVHERLTRIDCDLAHYHRHRLIRHILEAPALQAASPSQTNPRLNGGPRIYLMYIFRQLSSLVHFCPMKATLFTKKPFVLEAAAQGSVFRSIVKLRVKNAVML